MTRGTVARLSSGYDRKVGPTNFQQHCCLHKTTPADIYMDSGKAHKVPPLTEELQADNGNWGREEEGSLISHWDKAQEVAQA